MVGVIELLIGTGATGLTLLGGLTAFLIRRIDRCRTESHIDMLALQKSTSHEIATRAADLLTRMNEGRDDRLRFGDEVAKHQEIADEQRARLALCISKLPTREEIKADLRDMEVRIMSAVNVRKGGVP